jgi:hypothetical protein
MKRIRSQAHAKDVSDERLFAPEVPDQQRFDRVDEGVE